MRPALPCLAEDDLLAFAGLCGRSLADAPDIEAHLADCATCNALLADVVARSPASTVASASPSSPGAQPWNALAGTNLGPYRLDAQLGAGGMGAVYRAWDTRLDRAIAIKVLHVRTDAARLATEARAAAAISHPGIVAIHDVGTADGIAYVAMELVDGESLRSVIDRGALSLARTRELGVELADALAAAHARGVIHRDLKPENLVLARDHLRILDFGLAKLVDAGSLDETEPGTIQGTAGYMAPEQARGEPADTRTDLFATGAILFELATSRRAFPGATHADRLTAALRDTPSLDALGPLAPILARLLAKDPRDRFQSAADLSWTLGTCSLAPRAREPVRPSLPSRRAVLLGGGAAVLAGVGGFLLGRRRTVAPLAHPEFRQLTYRTGRVYTARFTRDGNRVVFGAAWDGEPLRAYVAELVGGGASPLELAGDVLAVSARGELAASLGRRFTDHQSATGTLATLPLAGGPPRVLAEHVEDADFTADGALAIARPHGTGSRLELPLGTVLVETPGWLTHPRVSPDGARVAYLAHPHRNDDAGDLMIVDVATRKTRALAAGWASIAGLAWADAGTIWFTAARDSGANEVRSVTLDGTLRAIAQTTSRLRLHDVAAGKAIVSVDAWRLRTLAGSRTDDRDRSLSEVSFVSDLSADGAHLVVGEHGNPETALGAYLVPFAGGKPLRLGDGFPLAISPSGQRVAALLGDQLVVYSTATGDHPTLATPGPVTAARWIDETSLVAIARSPDNTRLWRLALDAPPKPFDLAMPRDRTTHTYGERLAIDPARGRCAIVIDGQVRVVDLATGTARTLGGVAPGVVCGWLAEPDAIVLRSPTIPIELVRMDPATGATAPHLTIQPPTIGLKGIDSVVIHPDGVRYAYSYGQELSHLYVMTLARS